jgi:hypothetical protein
MSIALWVINKAVIKPSNLGMSLTFGKFTKSLMSQCRPCTHKAAAKGAKMSRVCTSVPLHLCSLPLELGP